MGRASSLQAYEAALTALERELLRLSVDPFTSEQVARKGRLDGKAGEAHQGVAIEKQEAEITNNGEQRHDNNSAIGGCMTHTGAACEQLLKR